jgi:CubicO group peptidase (beta-lactamase class C family)
VALLSALSAAATTPQEALDSKLAAVEAIIDAQLSKEAVPGGAFGLVSDQDTLWTYSFGVEDLSQGQAVTADSAFSICSVSKLFTGIAIMDLQEAGQIDLDVPIGQYLDFDLGAEADDVTVGNLLSHVSGFPREGATDYWWDNLFPDETTLQADVIGRSDWYDPYDHWQYSNLGMAALGQVIAGVSGQSFHEYVSDEILEPLGLSNTSTDMPFDKVGEGFARGYYVRDAQGNRAPVQPHLFKAFAPAAGVASSVNDLTRFMAWHFRLRDGQEEEVLQPQTLKRMQRIHWTGEDFDEPHWGLAYAARRVDGKTLWGHGGYCPGSVTELMMRNADKIGVVAMATANDVSAGRMARIIYGLTAAEAKALRQSAEATDSETAEPSAYKDYEGVYRRPNYDWDVYIGVRKEGLFDVPLYDNAPHEDVETYKFVEDDLFVRVRDDGSDAEPLRFLRDQDGQISGVIRGGYRLLRD